MSRVDNLENAAAVNKAEQASLEARVTMLQDMQNNLTVKKDRTEQDIAADQTRTKVSNYENIDAAAVAACGDGAQACFAPELLLDTTPPTADLWESAYSGTELTSLDRVQSIVSSETKLAQEALLSFSQQNDIKPDSKLSLG
jgi:hypothetical protein